MSERKPWWQHCVATPDRDSQHAAERHQARLTKPAGALGVLETLAIQFAAFQNTLKPRLDTVVIRVYAADHGVCVHGVSAFPQAVTGQMVQNFAAGGAAISVLARHIGADFAVVNMGTVNVGTATVAAAGPLLTEGGVINCAIGPGTRDFTHGPAMTEAECLQAMQHGRDTAPECAELFIGGEMGIGNTTAASAIYSALLGMPVAEVVGPGTGVDAAGLRRKCQVVEAALKIHALTASSEPLTVLSCVGGFEIAALVGAYIACAQRGVPVLVDGFITTAAALVALQLNSDIRPWLLFSHRSAEPAHLQALQKLGARPLLDLGLRLGEGSGAALAVDLIRAALRLHSEMARFEQAGVSER